MNINPELELVILEHRCPECRDKNLYFLPHDPGTTFDVECDTCGWEGYFTQEEAEVFQQNHLSFWKYIDNWQD